ncbi:MAG TPA: wax ester/triacylglycerol synthase family O-acyltransferase [Jiangellaceae bacterium]|nr:wax ester/triacylglycerol synthase family O-acyltransferase [Jiangellaceae bacterium]
MADRLTPLDASILYLESSETPMHAGNVAIFDEPAGGFDYDALVALVADRITLVPRYRQKVRPVFGRLARPLWVDDADFDLTYHVRRSALPRPGADEQLRELVARVLSRPLDRDRPLWEMYLVEGLAGGRFAVLSKTHHAIVDEITAVDIGQVILDDTPEPRLTSTAEPWRPQPGPGPLDLFADAVAEVVRHPNTVVDQVRTGLTGLEHAAQRVIGNVGGLAEAARAAVRPAPPGPLNVPIGSQRRFETVDAPLERYRRIRTAQGGTVNDVVLATLAGALRGWMMTRGEAVRTDSSMRALVPVSVQAPPTGNDVAVVGNQVASYLLDLPIGEPNPIVRLQRISYGMRAHADTGRAVSARALVELAGFAPSTLHALGARVASRMSRRLFNLIVTNVPGPQVPLYAAGARLSASYPVVPLTPGQAVAVGVTSYDGTVHYGLYGDRDAMPDLAVLSQCITDALDELLEASASR